MNPEKTNESDTHQQAIDDWERIGSMLEWIYLRSGELLGGVTDIQRASDMRVYVHDAINAYRQSGGILPQTANEQPVAPAVEPAEAHGAHKRGPKPDTFLEDNIDKDAFVLKLRNLLERKFEPIGKTGIIHMGEQNSLDLEPSKFFACLFSALIAHNVAKSKATPKGFDRLLKQVIEGSRLEGVFHLHYTSFNNVINSWLDLCKKEVQLACNCHTKKLIFELKRDDMDGLVAQKKLANWKLIYSYVEDLAARERLFAI